MVEKLHYWSQVYDGVNVISGPVFDYNFDGHADGMEQIQKSLTSYFLQSFITYKLLLTFYTSQTNNNLCEIPFVYMFPTQNFFVMNWSQSKDKQIEDCRNYRFIVLFWFSTNNTATRPDLCTMFYAFRSFLWAVFTNKNSFAVDYVWAY